MPFGIQQFTSEYGWITWMTIDDNCQEYPETFETREEAQLVIDEELYDLHRAYWIGDLDFFASEENYRIKDLDT